MEDAIALAVEMNERAWEGVKRTLADVTPEEAEWRPLRQANNINLIIRHLRIEAKWQFEAIDRGVPMPAEVSESEQKIIDAIPLDDFGGNMGELEKSCLGFIDALRRTTLDGWKNRENLPTKSIELRALYLPGINWVSIMRCI